MNDHGPYSTPFGAYVEKSKSNGQRSKSTSQRSRSTHGQPQPKPIICEHDPNSRLGPKSTFLIQFGLTLSQFLFVVGFVLISYVVS